MGQKKRIRVAHRMRGLGQCSPYRYRYWTLSILWLTVASCVAFAQVSPSVFINELHYDDQGQDNGEAIEVAGPAGTDLTGWRLVLYNGSTQKVYHERLLQGTISDQQHGFGTLVFDYRQSGIQNGGRDGVALVDASHQLIQFLSYEGTFEAADGPAVGLSSVEIGVQESASTPEGHALQLSGTGRYDQDFSWQEAAPHTFGQPNPGQSFGSGSGTINQPVKASCPATLNVQAGTPGQASLSAVDPDGVITAVTTLTAAIPGVTLSQIALGPNASAIIEVAETTAASLYPFTVVFKNADTPVRQAICTVRINVTTEIIRPGIRLTRDSWNATVVTQNARVPRPWRSRLQEPASLKLQSVPP